LLGTAGEFLSVAEPWLERDVHPLVINAAYLRALGDMLQIMNKLAVQIDVKNRAELVKIVNSCLGKPRISPLSLFVHTTVTLVLFLPFGSHQIRVSLGHFGDKHGH
jgi:chaperonin GroEL (HSP60 family)